MFKKGDKVVLSDAMRKNLFHTVSGWGKYVLTHTFTVTSSSINLTEVTYSPPISPEPEDLEGEDRYHDLWNPNSLKLAERQKTTLQPDF